MKKLKGLASLMIMGSLFMGSAKAVELSTEDYARLRNVFSEGYISTMTQEEIDKYLEYDLENAKSDSIYYKGVSYNNGSYKWTEVSKDEYDSESDIEPLSTYISTQYKEVSITYAYNDFADEYTFYLTANWKYMPAVRSYDVIAFRFRNVAIINGSQGGAQIFKRIGENYYDAVSYSPNGTNIQKLDQGFGISMNLVDDDINSLELNLHADGIKSGSSPYVWGNYQHAVTNVTLAQSKQYNISSAGYGNVLNFTTDMENKYDGMGGVYIAL